MFLLLNQCCFFVVFLLLHFADARLVGFLQLNQRWCSVGGVPVAALVLVVFLLLNQCWYSVRSVTAAASVLVFRWWYFCVFFHYLVRWW